MSDLQARLEKLAQRGTPRGAVAVLDAATTSVEHDAVTAVGMEPAPSRSPRRHISSLVAAAGVAATLFVLMLAFSAFIGAGGGSDSPEGAVQQLADAVNNEDPLAAADVLAPEEVQSLSQTVDVAARRAQELALARSAATPLAGLDLSVDNLDLSTETMADGYVKVTVANGDFSTRTESDKFSPVMQQALRNTKGNWSTTNLATLAKRLDLPTFVMTVQRGGHWYVSAAYTTLEYIREANQLPPADFGSGVRATATLGADTPNDAVRDAMTALANQDWEKLISLAAPDELPVYDYRATLTELGKERKTGFTINSLAIGTDRVDGDTAKVSLHAKGTTNEDGEWVLDGSCFKPPLDEGRVAYTGDWCSSAFLVPFFGSHPDSAATSRVTVVRQEGRWFVSAIGTALDLVDQYVRDLTQRQLYTALNVPQQLPVDGKLTLGTPVELDDAFGGAYVYALDAHRGDRYLGLVTTTQPDPGDGSGGADVLVYSPDGKVLRNTYRLIDGGGLEIPADGTYKVIIRPYLAGTSFTIWAEADYTDAAKHPSNAESFQGCEPLDNGMSCSSSASSASSVSSSSSSSSESSSGPVSSSGSESSTTATTVVSGPGG